MNECEFIQAIESIETAQIRKVAKCAQLEIAEKEVDKQNTCIYNEIIPCHWSVKRKKILRSNIYHL